MMRVNIFSTFLFLITTGAAFAQAEGRVTHPIPNEPFMDFKIDQCAATRAFGNYHYLTEIGPVIVLSDICVDEEKGTVTSYESQSGYTLVEKSKNGKRLEIIESSIYQELRDQLNFTNFDCTENDEYFVFYGGREERINIPDDTYGSVGVNGYTLTQNFSMPSNTEAEFAALSLHSISQAQFPQRTKNVEDEDYLGGLDHADFLGNLTFSDGSGAFLITEGGGHAVVEAGGAIDLKINSDGTVSLSGHVNGKNQRLAGHKPDEWISMTAEILYMRGHVLGADGNALKAFGFAKGSYEDINGETHQFHALAGFQACVESPG
ncbi:hypothetical protein [Candidatus Rhodobacter oscarellae]|uniref:hypothetical protein n=1 Tax=Candidatus Rhodobacter oscarellae TaxID=1675527 RepID=UPI000B02BA50|nr:hypothetical protein [Candidatus Rhodobacter lobularis]